MTNPSISTGEKSVLDPEVIDSLRELGGDDGGALLRELVELFMQDTPPRMVALEDAMQKQDGQALERAAHALKSSCANMGARQLASLCKQLEDSGRQGTFAAAAEIITLSKQEFDAVTRALSELKA
jgi:HPt (histidine-containing phosphotransfer) domain-containing protein